MTEQKRFQNQTLNSEDYERVEKGAKTLKIGGGLLGGVLAFFAIKFSPNLLKVLKEKRII